MILLLGICIDNIRKVLIFKMKKKSIVYNDLIKISDDKYREFTRKLTPNIKSENILGVRIPTLRKFARQLLNEDNIKTMNFLDDLPHFYYDENNLHALIISELKEFDQVVELIDEFLPFVDNWATCDIINPKTFKKKNEQLLYHIRRWISSDHEYTIRFGIEILMIHYLDEKFEEKYFEWIYKIKHDGYYVKMAIAWYFATALAKQYENALSVIEGKKLDMWTHNMTIQKAIESRRIDNDRKQILNSLKIRQNRIY